MLFHSVTHAKPLDPSPNALALLADAAVMVSRDAAEPIWMRTVLLQRALDVYLRGARGFRTSMTRLQANQVIAIVDMDSGVATSIALQTATSTHPPNVLQYVVHGTFLVYMTTAATTLDALYIDDHTLCGPPTQFDAILALGPPTPPNPPKSQSYTLTEWTEVVRLQGMLPLQDPTLSLPCAQSRPLSVDRIHRGGEFFPPQQFSVRVEHNRLYATAPIVSGALICTFEGIMRARRPNEVASPTVRLCTLRHAHTYVPYALDGAWIASFGKYVRVAAAGANCVVDELANAGYCRVRATKDIFIGDEIVAAG